MAKLDQRTNHALRVIVMALQSPRTRYGKLDVHRSIKDDLASIARSYPQIPHGGYDTLDQMQMILTCILERKPQSIMDIHRHWKF